MALTEQQEADLASYSAGYKDGVQLAPSREVDYHYSEGYLHGVQDYRARVNARRTLLAAQG